MNGHPSRLTGRGLKIAFSYHKFEAGNHRSAVCSDELNDEQASALATIVGQLGVREIDEAEFLKLTGRLAKSLPPQKVRPVIHALAHTPAPETTHSSVFVMLGRYGDVCNILPLLKSEADAGRRPTLVISKDFQDILDGVSYCDRIVWDGAYDQLPEALRWLRRDKGIVSPVVCQYHRNPVDKARLTDSYQKEVWRLAGRLDQFDARGPLVFDQRNAERERALVWSFAKDWEDNAPVIGIALESASSPLGANKKDAIYGELQRRFSKLHLVDLSELRAEKIFDMLAVLEMCSVVLTVDTSILHLARGLNREVVAILNDGWRGSIAEHAREAIRYSDLTAEKVSDAVQRAYSGDPIILLKERGMGKSMIAAAKAAFPLLKYDVASIPVQDVSGPARVIHAVDTHGTGPRFDKARESWQAAYAEGMIPAHFTGGPRNAKTELGDPRELPFLKDVLWAAIPADSTERGGDIVCWTNGDVGFAPGAVNAIRDLVGRHGAASMRRTESNGQGHPGRDLFAFTVDWLHEHWEEIPDFVLGAPVFDLGLVALIRKFHGIPPLTVKSLSEDMAPADMAPGFALHESHAPEWQVPNVDAMPSVRWNKKLFRDWNAKYRGGLKFSPGGNLK